MYYIIFYCIHTFAYIIFSCIIVLGFISPLMRGVLSTGLPVMWMENTETAAIVVVDSFIYKEYMFGGSPEINCSKGKEKERKGERTLQ